MDTQSKAAPAFTPGPWRVVGLRVWSEAAKDRGSVAECDAIRLGVHRQDEAAANAHLIAAAPEMYAALEAAEMLLPVGTALGMVQAALARARGEAEGGAR